MQHGPVFRCQQRMRADCPGSVVPGRGLLRQHRAWRIDTTRVDPSQEGGYCFVGKQVKVRIWSGCDYDTAASPRRFVSPLAIAARPASCFWWNRRFRALQVHHSLYCGAAGGAVEERDPQSADLGCKAGRCADSRPMRCSGRSRTGCPEADTVLDAAAASVLYRETDSQAGRCSNGSRARLATTHISTGVGSIEEAAG